MNYFNDYRKMINQALYTVDELQILNIETHLINMAKKGTPLLVCGNGGSAAITEHLSCDHTKGVALDTNLNPFIIPLQSNVSLNTAIANDIGFSKVFSEQIKWFSNKFDLLVISSSGNSPNIINAVKAAKQKGALTMAMVGFDGGKIKNMVDICVHVHSDNYGIVEDCHQIIMHSIAQSIRIQYKIKEEIKL